jgi:alkanesulfonate monooxygenase SsuD/methylene tetrahydromethanopterin reductase-like flavin-dependent oxidoreductase (luciferase family)
MGPQPVSIRPAGTRGEAAMRCSINIANLGDFADPRRVADIARLAEEAGSDGLFVWDHLIGYNQELVGEFGTSILLVGSAALATERIRLGTQVTPVGTAAARLTG